jgi:phospholipid/cholesterol/gamma-HCH transport system substrate-binding protein
MSRARDVRVGLFVAAGIAMSALVIFLIGDERRLFSSAVEFKTHFSDVEGLKPGAPIRMGGIDIGHVSSVGYGSNPTDTTVYVTLSIVKAEAGRVKTDCVAQITTKGLLGDKMIEVSKGKAAESVPPNGEVAGAEPDDVMAKVGSIAEKAEGAIEKIKDAAQGLADEGLNRDLRGSMASLHVVLDQVANGPGYPHRFLTDHAEADHISDTMQHIDRAMVELTSTVEDARGIVDRVKQGPGFAHDILYGDGPSKQISQFGDAAGEVATMLKGVRESDSFAHDALYGGKGGNGEALANVNAITGDLRVIVSNMRQGKGTLGALLVDPSIYEDMKSVLGNVQRNDVLRALVRYSIKQDEKKPTVEVSGTPAAKNP